jgi:hypothetical protein
MFTHGIYKYWKVNNQQDCSLLRSEVMYVTERYRGFGIEFCLHLQEEIPSILLPYARRQHITANYWYRYTRAHGVALQNPAELPITCVITVDIHRIISRLTEKQTAGNCCWWEVYSRVFSFGWFIGVWSLNTNVSERSVWSIFIGG